MNGDEDLRAEIAEEAGRLRLAVAGAAFPLGVLLSSGKLDDLPELRRREVEAVVKAARRVSVGSR